MRELQETWVWSLDREEPLEEGMEIHSSIFAWKILWTEKPGGLESIGLRRVRHNCSNWSCMHTKLKGGKIERFPIYPLPPTFIASSVLIQILVTSSCLDELRLLLTGFPAHRLPTFYSWPAVRIQFSSVAQSCPTLCNPMDCSMLGCPVITNSRSLLKLMSVMPSNHFILCRPLLLLPSIFPSIGVFSNESVLRIRWPKYWSLSFSISPSNEYSGLIFFQLGLLRYNLPTVKTLVVQRILINR